MINIHINLLVITNQVTAAAGLLTADISVDDLEIINSGSNASCTQSSRRHA